MDSVAQEKTNPTENSTQTSRLEDFKDEVKDAVDEVVTEVVDTLEDKGWKKTAFSVLLMIMIVLAPLTIYKAIPVAKNYVQGTVGSKASVKTVPHLELEAIHDRVRELSQLAAVDPVQRKAALDERAVLIGRVKVMASSNDFKGASPLALEWLERIKDDANVSGNDRDASKAPIVIKKKETPQPIKTKTSAAKPEVTPQETPPVKSKPIVPSVEPKKCSVNDIGDCADWRKNISP
jgi:hypothetical protein